MDISCVECSVIAAGYYAYSDGVISAYCDRHMPHDTIIEPLTVDEPQQEGTNDGEQSSTESDEHPGG